MPQSLNSRFDKNLEALFKVNPLLAAQLQILEPNKKYEVYIGQDPLNINIYDKENKLALYAREPLVQTLEKIKEFEPLKLYPFLYFFNDKRKKNRYDEFIMNKKKIMFLLEVLLVP